MSQWKNIGAVVALSFGAALAGTGCLAQGSDYATNEPEIAMADQQVDADQQVNTVGNEKTGEADQAWLGWGWRRPFWGGFGGLGWGGWGGLGWGGLGFGYPFYGGFGGCGLGLAGCGLGLAGCGLGLAGCGLGFGYPFYGGFGACW